MIAVKKPSKLALALLAAAGVVVSPAPSAMAQAPVPKANEAAAKPERKKGSTIVTSEKQSTFDNVARRASFAGDVKVTDPEFELTCDELVVFLRDEKTPEKTPNGKSSSALSKAVADGNVIVLQRRQTEEGGEKVYRGKAEHGVYDAASETFVLSGWPQVQQGINTHIATEQATVMTITKDGGLKTDGGSRTTISESPDEP